ncbi:MAG: AAA family ATPase, partial [Anaerolineales bacterium]|nr:AAA family ATPase [Anaerolineales bacterium]
MIQDSASLERPSSRVDNSLDYSPAIESPLLRTKLHPPHATATLLTRPRLTEQLTQHPNGSLILLSAPAGFGKTTLVADWIRQQSAPAAWLTLDEQDNDPMLFWRYLIAALQVIDPRLGLHAQAALASLTRISLETAVTFLINDIATYVPADTPLILVLDDFHWIHDAAIHHSLNYLLQHQPPQLHLLILTRADPPLSLARLRVEGRLMELRAADLRLTLPEIGEFFNRVMALGIPDEAVSLLADRTEGWAAGLQLAALSLRQPGPVDSARRVYTFAGARQHVFAYLMEEVLYHQPEEVRQFLRETAVLGQFSASLCTAVTGQQDADRLLAQLAAANLFLTPLDDQGQWYRYHPLFAEMLRAGLDETAVQTCHRRAAHWYAEQQLLPDAIRHALAASDYDLLVRLLEQTYKTLLANGFLVSLQKWLAAVPNEFQTPRLRLAFAWARIYESGEADLQRTLTGIREQLTAMDGPLQGEILAVQAIYSSLYGQPEQSIEWAKQALGLIAPDDFLSLAAAYQALGNAYRYQGQLDGALDAYAQAVEQFKAMGDPFMAHLPIYRMAHIQILQGHLYQARQTYELVRQQAQAAGYEPLIMSGEVFGHLSDLYWEWNDLEQAAAFARQEIELAQTGRMLLALVDGYLKLAAVLAAQGDGTAAREHLALARETAVQLQSASVSAQVDMHCARHQLTGGDLATAAEWAEAYAHRRKSPACVLNVLMAQSADLLLARIWLLQGRTDTVLQFLDDIIPELTAVGRNRLLVEAHILQALAWDRKKDEANARKALLHALALAKPEGYMRVFIENGHPLAALLAEVRSFYPEYVPQLPRAMTE